MLKDNMKRGDVGVKLSNKLFSLKTQRDLDSVVGIVSEAYDLDISEHGRGIWVFANLDIIISGREVDIFRAIRNLNMIFNVKEVYVVGGSELLRSNLSSRFNC